MKLIIEIGDNIVENMRDEGVCKADPKKVVRLYQATIADAIVNGIPYNPTDDLISREALKKELNSRPFPQDYSTTLLLGTFNELIDNAPAVEARPQGEWIPMSTDCRGYSESFKCSICGAYIYPRCLEKELDYNLCPYCGADMKGSEENG